MKKQTSEKSQTEAETFVEFTRKILAVPKKEIDAEKVKYEKERKRKNEKRGT
ncbi:MAG TPA: hypothetical protein VM864_04760 [Pyrinomonadaceae bacterium]|jgi:hypothetical protein|nr:hypothetical protein [Pyrinomonadaceae bacterium]